MYWDFLFNLIVISEMLSMRVIDYIVYVVIDLDEVILEFEVKIGIRFIFGGYY